MIIETSRYGGRPVSPRYSESVKSPWIPLVTVNGLGGEVHGAFNSPEDLEDLEGEGEIIEVAENEEDKCADKIIAPDPGAPSAK